MSTTIKYRYNFFLISKICFTGKPFPYFILFHLNNVAFYYYFFCHSVAKLKTRRTTSNPLLQNEMENTL